MILTQYQAWKKYGMSVTILRKNSNRVPRPKYFIDVKSGAPRIDEDHSEFKQYVKLLKLKKQGYPDSNSADLLRIINATIKVITDRYDEDEARAVIELIMLELKT